MWGTDYQLLSPSFRTLWRKQEVNPQLPSFQEQPGTCPPSGTTIMAEVLAHTHQWGTESFLPCQPWPYKAQHGLQALAASLPSMVPACFPASVWAQGSSQASPQHRWEGALVGWASSFPWQMNLLGKMCLQNTPSLIHPLWSSQKTLPQDLTFPCLPWRNFGTQSDPTRPTSGVSSFISPSFAFFLPFSLFKFNLTRQFTTFFTALHLVEPHLCMQNASKSKC